jgi:hypothetical protein
MIERKELAFRPARGRFNALSVHEKLKESK